MVEYMRSLSDLILFPGFVTLPHHACSCFDTYKSVRILK